MEFWDLAMGDESNDFHRETVRPKITELLDPNSTDYILDIACGNGNYSVYFAAKDVSVVTFDYSEKMLELAKKRQAGFIIDGFDEECYKSSTEISVIIIVRIRKAAQRTHQGRTEMIHETLDINTEPLLTPEAVYGKHEKICDVCVITFSYKVMKWALQHLDCRQAAEIGCCNGNRPVYLTEWKGKKIAFYMTLISAPGAAACLEEALCLTGCRKYVVFGSCGTLNRQLTDGKIIVPTWACRDEGLSYHYIAASEYIEMKEWERVAAFLEGKGIAYVTGRTWTTDAVYRETSGKAERLRNDGCIAVEMELAGMQAVCEYHGLTLKAFLFASDCLEPEAWHNELLGSEREWDMQVKCFLLALDLALL